MTQDLILFQSYNSLILTYMGKDGTKMILRFQSYNSLILTFHYGYKRAFGNGISIL